MPNLMAKVGHRVLLCVRLEGVSCEENLECEGIGGADSLAGNLPKLLIINDNAANGEGVMPALAFYGAHGCVELCHFNASEIMIGECLLNAHNEKYACVTCASFFKCLFRNTFDLFHSLTIHYKISVGQGSTYLILL